MNQYQAKLEPKLFQCSLGLEDNTQIDRPVKYARMNRTGLLIKTLTTRGPFMD